ncbi:HAD family hydrolase [Paenibacillus brasilensis]|uniref:Hydroxymethylpyrimidine pyrophosphatase-like HAD family hydrolase n=1 Tax=Paenibacillus brasilensis TaxID=128574 RepID=A0ABU0L2L9_9BACL|nr:HAD hydrolase family protein [Paenibacillus brasilensis]MDQ0495280.1 hydroxymethylpyrimidine pyrophosphatase-like HAD family hydrolase [Paenibacillus brasilensis]
MNFVFDLDGTICFKGQPLDEQVCHALDACMQHGHEVIFASARPIRDLLPILPKEYHHFRMVGGNGAFTYADQKIGVTYFPNEVQAQLVEIALTHNLQYLAEVLIDISPPGMDKAKGLDQLGITEYIAFGNDANDRVLFEQAIYSVCVGHPPVSRYANEMVTPANVAEKIQELAYRYGKRR